MTLAIPVNERTAGDQRANALASLTISVDPARVTEDLGEVRAKTKQGLRALQETPNELLQALPLTPLTPKRLARRLTGLAYGDADLPVGCSNLGEIDPAINRPDGSDADYVSARLVKNRAQATIPEPGTGQLFLSSMQLGGRISINVIAHQPGREISKHELQQLITGVLAASICRPDRMTTNRRHSPHVSRAPIRNPSCRHHRRAWPPPNASSASTLNPAGAVAVFLGAVPVNPNVFAPGSGPAADAGSRCMYS